MFFPKQLLFADDHKTWESLKFKFTQHFSKSLETLGFLKRYKKSSVTVFFLCRTMYLTNQYSHAHEYFSETASKCKSQVSNNLFCNTASDITVISEYLLLRFLTVILVKCGICASENK